MLMIGCDFHPSFQPIAIFDNQSGEVQERRLRQRTENASEEPTASMALSHGVQKKWKLWTAAGRAELEKLELLPYAAERRQHLLETLDQLQADIERLKQRVEAEAGQRPQAVKL